MRVIGLTGGIASGKSLVSQQLAERGAVVIDADKVGHEAYRQGTETFQAMVDAFGSERCVWGSDFPNHLWTPKLTFAEHLRIFTEALPLKTGDRENILGGTANRLYFGGKLEDEAA